MNIKKKIDCFLPCEDLRAAEKLTEPFRSCSAVEQVYLLISDDMEATMRLPENVKTIATDYFLSAKTMCAMAHHASADYVLFCMKSSPVIPGHHALERLLQVASATGAKMVYADRYSVEDGKMVKHPTIDYQAGSVRDDFDFGSLVLIATDGLKEYERYIGTNDYKFAGWYDLRLFLSRVGKIFHLNEYLYIEEENDLRASGEKQFDYVNPRNRDVQIEMEKTVTNHLSAMGALIDTEKYIQPDFKEDGFEVEASVVIPVFNREKTIHDAVESALKQQTDFKYNVIVVDNHSTDSTTAILSKMARTDERLIHLIPHRNDLGIGGCWNYAIDDARCGRFAVQLDSDDLYSSNATLRKIVHAFREQKAAMIIGSYRMCDFELNTLPPGLIDHAEWTEANGCNNALRINGLGAPRAFYTPLAREIRFPNTSYGEDYAVGLAFSRQYRIGRIYEELYLCRRWGGNSDAALSVEKINSNNLYKDRIRTIELLARQELNKGGDEENAEELKPFFYSQLDKWNDAKKRYADLKSVHTRTLGELETQFNPARMVSTGAKIDKIAIATRPCFLCGFNRPEEQMVKSFNEEFDILVNPFPILPIHFTIACKQHQPQRIAGHYATLHRLANAYPGWMFFYNGPKCGASAPDHLHFQGGSSNTLPLRRMWNRLNDNAEVLLRQNEHESISLIKDFAYPAIVIRSRSVTTDEQMFRMVYDALPLCNGDAEPMMNIIVWKDGADTLSIVFPRRKHRPDCYFASGEKQYLISPGALDMGGLLILPRKEDFDRITAEHLKEIMSEVVLSSEQMEKVSEKIRKHNQKLMRVRFPYREPIVKVGIVSGEELHFTLNGTFEVNGRDSSGKQIVILKESEILWHGQKYRELFFVAKAESASITLEDVTIGVNFHWERKEAQTFQGNLRLVIANGKICAINELPVETYLTSVISSEMRATSSLELLKAHAVISRSWLLAQIEKRKRMGECKRTAFSLINKDDELIRWYDREDHTIFDVCADDHCQRYQGITKSANRHVAEAIRRTSGEILTYDGKICDARYSKCCGGATEEFQYCWENIKKPYLVSLPDTMPDNTLVSDLTNEENARKWILSSPQAFCNTKDASILRQVLNDFDQETQDFYRWTQDYDQQTLSALIEEKTGMKFGKIIDLMPLERGVSGRIFRLRIVGTERSLTIGKELEIRRVLSKSHLYSSAFVVEKSDFINGVAQKFHIVGAGWGHGVGLCQIGAAVMGAKGYEYKEILLHYYRGASIEKIY
ncbi:UNVERIFIED_CONTAM: DUF4922 domain-containing protein [Prevotella sp. 15_C9]